MPTALDFRFSSREVETLSIIIGNCLLQIEDQKAQGPLHPTTELHYADLKSIKIKLDELMEIRP